MRRARAAVRAAQQTLNAAGGALVADGWWGPRTDKVYVAAAPGVRSSVDDGLASAGFPIEVVRKKFIAAESLGERVKVVVDAATRAGVVGTSLVNLLATVKVESGFVARKESSVYRDPDRARALFPPLRELSDAQIAALTRSPDRFFETVYGYRTAKGKDLGNRAPGHGALYPGRGHMQITGLYNYEQFARASGHDVVKNPDLLLDPTISAEAAVWFWKTFVVSRGADGDIRRATKIVNAASEGLAARVAAAQQFATFA